MTLVHNFLIWVIAGTIVLPRLVLTMMHDVRALPVLALLIYLFIFSTPDHRPDFDDQSSTHPHYCSGVLDQVYYSVLVSYIA